MQEYLDKWQKEAIPAFGDVFGDHIRVDSTLYQSEETPDDLDIKLEIMNFGMTLTISDVDEDTESKFSFAAYRAAHQIKDMIIDEYARQWREQTEDKAE